MPTYTLASTTRIFYKLEGNPENPLLVLAHGYGSNCSTFDKIFPLLIDRYYILRWDHRGHGQSDAPTETKYEETLPLYTISQLALDLHEILVGLSLITRSNIYYYGHSMGGMVLLQFMTYFPNICTAVIIGSSTAGDDSGSIIEQVEGIKAGNIILDEEYFKDSTKKGYTRKFAKENPLIIKEEIERKLSMNPLILTVLLENMAHHYDLYQELKNINVPTLILHGGRDQTLHHIFGIKLHDTLPNSLFIKIPKMSHGINYEIPEKVAKHISNFILLHN
ncbi:alpha/beta fold hydrolase [Candidatus Lokiarchaeum ossiferum]|uniref:alpha/beta fold hydrolase n=1 Tax=Candidatus Lokiarchaeum ossiferum TaxID=2951803 RepID=UPI00352F876E